MEYGEVGFYTGLDDRRFALEGETVSQRGLTGPINPLHPRLLETDNAGNHVILQGTNAKGTGPVNRQTLDWYFIRDIVELAPTEDQIDIIRRSRHDNLGAAKYDAQFRYADFERLWRNNKPGLERLYSRGLSELLGGDVFIDSTTFWNGIPRQRDITPRRLGEEWWNKTGRGPGAKWNIAGPDKTKFIQEQIDRWDETILEGDPDYVAPVTKAPAVPPTQIPITNIAEARTGQPARITTFRGSGREDIGEVYEGMTDPVLGEARYSALNREDAANYGPNIEELDITLQNPLVVRKDDQWAQILREAGGGALLWCTSQEEQTAEATIKSKLKATKRKKVP